MPYCKKCGNELPEGAKFCPKCGTPTSETPAAPVTPVIREASAAAGFNLASWGERFVAWLIDAILVTVVMGIITGIIGVISLFSGFSFTSIFNFINWLPAISVNGIVIFFYWMFMEASNGQSIGKMAMGIKVTQLNGSPINMGQAAVESIGKAFFPLLVIDTLIGVILYPKNQQRLFNYLSQTIVVKVR
jgi:uncharacterized RDD family membrane protein YckC